MTTHMEQIDGILQNHRIISEKAGAAVIPARRGSAMGPGDFEAAKVQIRYV